MDLDLTEAIAALEKVSKVYMAEGDGGGEEDEGTKEEARDKLDIALMALRGNDGGIPQGQRFPGNCHHCGKPGHRVAECRIKDEEMRRIRGEKEKRK